MGKGKGNAANAQPKTWLKTANVYLLLTGLQVSCSSPGLSWALLVSWCLLVLHPKIKRQSLPGASHTRGQKLKGQATLKVLLKVSAQYWPLSLPSTPHGSK